MEREQQRRAWEQDELEEMENAKERESARDERLKVGS